MRSGSIGWIKRIVASRTFLYAAAAAVLLLVSVHYLISQPAGLSAQELAAKNSSQSLSQIINHPLNAPHRLLAYGFHALHLSWRTALRLSSISFGLVFVLSFYSLAAAWFAKSIGLMGTLVLAATPLVIVASRQGSAEIMYMAPITLMAAYAWTLRSDNKALGLGSLLALSAIFIYTPGLIWWLAGGLIAARKKLAAAAETVSPPVMAAACLISLLLLSPLLIALAKDWTLIKPLGLVPAHFAAPLTVLKETAWMAIALFVKAPYHSLFILGRLPVLNVVQTALLAIGVYALWSAARAKLAILLAALVLAVVAAGINNDISRLIIGLPAAGLLVCAGLRYLYIEWRGIFPRNPVARGLALTLMAVVVTVQLLFGIRYGAIAWPHTAGTKNSYVLK